MKRQAFTLIELLVVITIIGILATGAVGIYTSQLQKARDATRLNDISSINTAIQAMFNDKLEYPQATDFNDADLGIQKYLSVIPGDPRNLSNCIGGSSDTSYCGYTYNLGQDSSGINNMAYELSVAFENKGNQASKSTTDNGSDAYRYELGTLFQGSANIAIDTNIVYASDPSPTQMAYKGVCLASGLSTNGDVVGVGPYLINRNPSGATDCN